MRKSSSVMASCGLMLATLVAAMPARAAAPAAPDCEVAAPAAGLNAAPAADGTPAYRQWLDTEPGRRANLAIQQAADAAFAVGEGKERTAARVRRGLIGSAIDHNTQTVTLVVTPEQRDRAATLTGSLTSALASAQAVGVKTAVKVGCFSGERLAAADDLLFARAWHPDAAQAVYSYALRAADSRYHVSFDPRFPAAAQALQEALGEVAVVTLQDAARTGRLNDGEPHFGGAGVRAGSGATNTCSTGFVVRRNSDGLRGGTTAAHCFSNGQKIYSSTQYWGTASGEVNYPAYDLALVASSAETYDNVVHSDPCCPVQRNITAKRNSAPGDSICLSGMATKATCGVVVLSNEGVLCDAAGCTYALMEGARNGDVIVKAGDSGGPVYVRSGTSNATAVAMIIGCHSGCAAVLAERLPVIESHLGVTVLTS